jgi:secondary thiamine-phosphate synthase enzyme
MISGSFSIKTSATMECIDITSHLGRELAPHGSQNGLCFLFNPHTTAGLTINEGADPAVRSDLIAGLRQIVPLDFPFDHLEGNSPAHIMACLVGSSLTVAFRDGRLQLGTWQKLFFCEFDGPRTRTVHYHLLPAS